MRPTPSRAIRLGFLLAAAGGPGRDDHQGPRGATPYPLPAGRTGETRFRALYVVGIQMR